MRWRWPAPVGAGQQPDGDAARLRHAGGRGIHHPGEPAAHHDGPGLGQAAGRSRAAVAASPPLATDEPHTATYGLTGASPPAGRSLPALSSGSFPLPHFGDWTQDGHPVWHGHTRTASSVARQQPFAAVEPALGDPGPARVAVVDEDRARRRVGVERGGHAADVPSVARRDQREEPDRGMLRGVRRTGERGRRDPCAADHRVGDRPPYRSRVEPLRREVERHGIQDLPAHVQLRTNATTWLVTRTDPKNIGVSPSLDSMATSSTSMSVVSRDWVYQSASDRRTSGHRPVEVELDHLVLLALVQVDRAGVHLDERPGLVDRAQQRAGVRLHDGEQRPGRRSDVDVLVGAGAGPVMEAAPPFDQVAPFLHRRHHRRRRVAEERCLVARQRLLARRACQVRAPGRTGWTGRSPRPRAAWRTGPRGGGPGTGRGDRPGPRASPATPPAGDRPGPPAATSKPGSPGIRRAPRRRASRCRCPAPAPRCWPPRAARRPPASARGARRSSGR